MPVKDSYADRVFTSDAVRYPNILHINNRDFSSVIEKALELGGFLEDTLIPGINGGHTVTTGFGHGTVFRSCR